MIYLFTFFKKILNHFQLTARDLKLPSVDHLIIFDMPAISVFEDFVSIANAKRIFTFFESRDLEKSPALVQFLKFNNQVRKNYILGSFAIGEINIVF